MNTNNRREKIFYVVMIIFYLIFPFTLFFDVFEYKYTALKEDHTTVKVVEKYNLVNIKDLSIFPLIISILFIVISLVLAIILIIDLYKGKYYSIYVKLLSCASTVIFMGLVFYFGLYLMGLFFMIICCNLFMLSFDIKLNRKYKLNLLIYIPTYLLFIVMMLLAFGFQPMK